MTITAIHPGEHLVEELKELKMSAAELARHLDVPTNRITEILNGQRAISADTALRLAHFFGTSPRILVESSEHLRLAPCARESRQNHSGVAETQAPRYSKGVTEKSELMDQKKGDVQND